MYLTNKYDCFRFWAHSRLLNFCSNISTYGERKQLLSAVINFEESEKENFFLCCVYLNLYPCLFLSAHLIRNKSDIFFSNSPSPFRLSLYCFKYSTEEETFFFSPSFYFQRLMVAKNNGTKQHVLDVN